MKYVFLSNVLMIGIASMAGACIPKSVGENSGKGGSSILANMPEKNVFGEQGQLITHYQLKVIPTQGGTCTPIEKIEAYATQVNATIQTNCSYTITLGLGGMETLGNQPPPLNPQPGTPIPQTQIPPSGAFEAYYSGTQTLNQQDIKVGASTPVVLTINVTPKGTEKGFKGGPTQTLPPTGGTSNLDIDIGIGGGAIPGAQTTNFAGLNDRLQALGFKPCRQNSPLNDCAILPGKSEYYARSNLNGQTWEVRFPNAPETFIFDVSRANEYYKGTLPSLLNARGNFDRDLEIVGFNMPINNQIVASFFAIR